MTAPTWKEILISPSTTIREAIKTIDSTSMEIAVVVDESQTLLGTLTDSDVRHGILEGKLLDGSVTSVMNTNPVVGYLGEGRDVLLQKILKLQSKFILVVDKSRKIQFVEFLESLHEPHGEKPHWVVLIAGGLGSRLGSLTGSCPKPLIPVLGSEPILETTIKNLKSFGFRKFYVSVNYKAEMIQDYFGDGEKWGVQIRYLHEKQRLGTAGGMSLLNERPSHPILVMNGDVLTTLDFEKLLEFQVRYDADAVMCVREFDLQVPYGVVKSDKHCFVGVDEKPVLRFPMNAGIYLLKPSVLDLIPKDSYFEMTTLFEKANQQGMTATVFPILEYWLDIGRIDDLERAKVEYSGLLTKGRTE